jgi:kynureninase
VTSPKGQHHGIPNDSGHASDDDAYTHPKSESGDDTECGVYFVGNSLGAQPKAVRRYLNAQLETWASVGVNGHFTALGNSPLTAWQDMAEDCSNKLADIVGAKPHEVVTMNTLTANLHFMMASFYKPTKERHEIILEWRPFPSDHVSRAPCSCLCLIPC